jgi:hypothetical protein
MGLLKKSIRSAKIDWWFEKRENEVCRVPFVPSLKGKK